MKIALSLYPEPWKVALDFTIRVAGAVGIVRHHRRTGRWLP